MATDIELHISVHHVGFRLVRLHLHDGGRVTTAIYSSVDKGLAV